MKTALRYFATGFVLVPTMAWAAPDVQMICKNPAHEYFLSYRDGNDTAVINPDSSADQLSVLASLFDDRQYILIVKGDERMTALIHYAPFKKVDWFSDGELVQTDACHD